ncbi:MAG TPA: PilT/PilU family type 4a pilus ATPase [Phycisphaerae bacterium]|nr:PilT/PilU family type 4a pilus ATPase [Phycisphaerae bacterium]
MGSEVQTSNTEAQASTSSRPTPRLHKFFDLVTKVEGSDLHIKADAVPRIRKSGKLIQTTSPALSNTEVEEMVEEILKPEQWADYKRRGSIDVAYAVTLTERFRINIFRQRGLTSMAARRINPKIPNYAQLNLPSIFEKIADHEQGLVILAGITGSGKSTTIAAMLQQVNEKRSCHIVTIEDPIEYLYVDKKSFINQREIGLDVESFELAIKYMMREDPDVILIGEMRDRNTFQAAVQAAETGHMVFSTIHASSAPGAITRILELFPPDMHLNIRQAIAANMKAIVFQKLVPSIKPGVGRVPALEIMLTSPSVTKYILEGRENELSSVIRGEKGTGMIDFNDMLAELVEKEMVSPKEAYAASPNADELRMRMKGIRTN